MANDKILIVDDEATIRFVLRTLISAMGHEVVATGSAQEALSLVEREHFSVALLDIMLPDGSGIDVLDRIKRVSPDTAVIIMTSQASVETAINAIRKGAYDYFHKPFELDEVSATVTRAIERRSLTLRNRELLAELEVQNQELSAAVKRLDSLYAAGLAMSRLYSLEELLDSFLGLVVQELDVDRASVMLLGEDGQLRIAAARGIHERIVRTTQVSVGQGIAGWVVKTGQPILVKDVGAESGFITAPNPDLTDSFISVPIVLSVPIKSSGAVLGAINVTNRRSGAPFDEDDVAYLNGLAAQVAVAIERARHLESLESAIVSLQATQEQLVASERLKIVGELAAGVAHEINNTLNGILGRAQMLLTSIDRRAFEEPVFRRGLETIETLAQDAAETVRRLQDSARIRKNRRGEDLNLNAVVRHALELTRPKWDVESQLAGRAIEVLVELEDVPVTTGNPQEMVQVVSNIILNAIEAMPRGGRLNLRTWTANGAVLLDAQDTGVGMDPEIREKIFEPFFTTKEANQGLGLSVAYGIVTRLGGAITVESEPGQGTRFIVRLPLTESCPATPDRNGEPAAAAARPARVLVIDDAPENRLLYEEILSLEGHDVTAAASGAEGLSRLEGGPFDVVITDLSMPVMSGWEVAHGVKKHDPALPVIVLSGWAVQPDPAALREAGVEVALAKPISVDELLAAVRNAVGRVDDARSVGRSASPSR
jgi:DNA-binding NtrC family response regulator/nitrogen-specific signal transduction histidine kinase